MRPLEKATRDRLFLSVALALAATTGAHGQEITPPPQPVPSATPSVTVPPLAQEDRPVSERFQPEYDPIGFRLGSFLFNPSIDIGELWNSNILGSQDFERSDFITRVQPVVNLASDWDTNSLALLAQGDIQRYARYSSENVDNMLVRGDGRLDITRGQTLSVDASYQIAHEARYSPESLFAAGSAGAGLYARYPTEYSLSTGQVTYVYAPRRLGFELQASVNDYQYSNEPTLNGGLAIQGDLSRTEYAISPKVTYELSPDFEVFGEGWGNFREYKAPDATPQHYRRSSSGYALAAGTKLDIDKIITGEIYIGYQDQRYDDPRLAPNSGVYLGGSVLWNVTRLTSIKFAVNRSIQETNIAGSSGYWDTLISASVDHELLRNLILSAQAGYELQDYQGVDINNSILTAQLGGRWKFTRGYSVGANAGIQRRWSNVAFGSFTQALISIDLKATF
jgi:hypothetical protein